ncbi:MAG: V-type ATP synthase subunit D [Thermoproteota archaeon]|nr:V-type ATP synthase subunit D [Candidatus Brockarchaeota archaeon]
MSLSFKPTRYELLKLNKLLSIAIRSSKILQQRYQMLSQELFKTRDELKKLGLDINKELLRIYRLFDEAEEEIGEDKVKRAAATTIRLNEMNITWENVKGILIPKLSYSEYFPNVEDRGYYILETSEKVDKASEEMHKFLSTLVRYINLINRQRILSKELKKIERRYKALDYVLIPNLTNQKKRILSKLEEMEREEIARKKRVKEFLESKI